MNPTFKMRIKARGIDVEARLAKWQELYSQYGRLSAKISQLNSGYSTTSDGELIEESLEDLYAARASVANQAKALID